MDKSFVHRRTSDIDGALGSTSERLESLPLAQEHVDRAQAGYSQDMVCLEALTPTMTCN